MSNPFPHHITMALRLLSIDPSEADDYLSEFMSRWGGIEPIHLQQAMLASQAEDSAFAATALYFHGDHLWKQQEGVKLLHHTNPWIRWAIALSFGKERKDVALPTLCTLLTEGLNLDEFTAPSRTQFRSWRISISRIVVEYGDSTIAPYLKQALRASYNLEVQAQESMIANFKIASVRSYQMHCVYGLGRLKAWGTLLGITQDITRLHQWMILMVCGTSHKEFEIRLLKSWSEYPVFHQAIRKGLSSAFGLFEEEQNLILKEFEGDASNMRFIYFQSLNPQIW
jgi:hypothetical protein